MTQSSCSSKGSIRPQDPEAEKTLKRDWPWTIGHPHSLNLLMIEERSGRAWMPSSGHCLCDSEETMVRPKASPGCICTYTHAVGFQLTSSSLVEAHRIRQKCRRSADANVH